MPRRGVCVYEGRSVAWHRHGDCTNGSSFKAEVRVAFTTAPLTPAPHLQSEETACARDRSTDECYENIQF